MSRLIPVILLLAGSCTIQAPERKRPAEPGAEIYGGKVYGIYQPLKVEQDEQKIEVSGETFTYVIDKGSGQIVSAKALGTEFVAAGSSFPNPYIGIMPQSDPGATKESGADRARFSFEKAVETRPRLFSGGLTGAERFDAINSTAVVTQISESGPATVKVSSRGVYSGNAKNTPLSWQIDYLIDVDGFTKITVGLSTEKPVKLRWHCFNHAFFSTEAVDFISRYPDLGRPPFNLRPAPTVTIKDLASGEAVLESHWCPVFHLGNPLTGIDISKEDFGDRWSGYRDSRVQLEDGRLIDTGAVETEDGEFLRSHDSRGKRGIFTQIYKRNEGYELEEFGIRNTTYALNPGNRREKTFFIQLTPPKLPRNDLNSTRIVWPGPHQINMVRWRGRTEPLGAARRRTGETVGRARGESDSRRCKLFLRRLQPPHCRGENPPFSRHGSQLRDQSHPLCHFLRLEFRGTRLSGTRRGLDGEQGH